MESSQATGRRLCAGLDRLTARMSGGYGGGDEHPKPAMKRIGYFGEGGYMTIGEPYKTKVKESMPRYEGAQFQTNPTIVCDRFKLRNGQFSKAPPFSVGEPYVTLDQIHKREALKQKIVTSAKQMIEEKEKVRSPRGVGRVRWRWRWRPACWPQARLGRGALV